MINTAAANRTLRREISKLLGKFLLFLVVLTLLFCAVAIAVVLYTGCRPIEAAYVVLHKTVEKNDYRVKHAKFQHRATAPKSITKTKRDYFWLLPKKLDPFLRVYKQHKSTGFADYEELNKELSHYWTRKVLKHAGVPRCPETKRHYPLKTVRALRATLWVQLLTEYEVMGWDPKPPNPLSHTDKKTTIERYATKDANNPYEARNRCFEKYHGDPLLRQAWMDQ